MCVCVKIWLCSVVPCVRPKASIIPLVGLKLDLGGGGLHDSLCIIGRAKLEHYVSLHRGRGSKWLKLALRSFWTVLYRWSLCREKTNLRSWSPFWCIFRSKFFFNALCIHFFHDKRENLNFMLYHSSFNWMANIKTKICLLK